MRGKRKNKGKGRREARSAESHVGSGKEARDGQGFAEMLDYDLFDRVSDRFADESGSRPGDEPPPLEPPVQRQIDLHGSSAGEAEAKVASFLLTARLQGLSKVRIITGKGLHSVGTPVLPDLVELMVRRMREAGEIVRYRWERGGREQSGSLLVYL